MSWQLDPALERWLSEVEAAVMQVLPDADARIELIRRLQTEPPRLTLAGTFNTGKSSLLKRLCVDEDREVPAGLIIQGEPSTATIEAAQIGAWIVVDTPGLDAPHAEHAEAALSAARDADRVLLFVNPDLFSEGSPTAALLRELPPGSVALVVSRIDKAVMSPVELEAWASTKTAELNERLQRLGHCSATIFAIAPDARGLVRNSPAQPVQYDRSRAWDGIAELRRWLDAPPREAERNATLERRAMVVLHDATDRVRSLEASHTERREELEATIASLLSHIARLEAREAEARQSLSASTLEAARSGPSASARSRITVAADRELERTRREVRSLAEETGAEVPAWTVDLSLALQVPSTPDDGDAHESEIDYEQVEQKIEAEIKKHAVDSDKRKKLEQDLHAWKEAKRRNRTRDHYADDETSFGGVRDVREAERELADLRRRDFAVRLGEVALDTWREERSLRQQHAGQATAAEVARDRAEDLATRMVAALHDSPAGVASVFATLRSELEERQASTRESLAEIATEAEVLEQTAASIRELLRR